MVNTFSTAVGLAIIVSALCSVCEAVLYSITSSQVEMLKKKGHKSAPILQRLQNDIDEPITAILTLNTIANTVGAAVAGAAAAQLFGDENVLLFSAIFTISILIFSEILPKTIGVTFAVKLAPYIAFPLYWLIVILKPVIYIFRTITRLIPSNTENGNISAAELQTIAALSLKSGDIEPDQELVINNILELKKKIVRDVMTPRTVTFSLDENLTIDEAMKMKTRLNSHSRIPAYDKEPDNVTGIIMRKDVLIAAAEIKNKLTLSKLLQPAHFVPETAPLDKILIDFFDRKQHLFVVVDEYGSMTGIISMEDVIEEIVGREIMDESDRATDMRELARKQTIATRQRRI